MGDEIVFDGGMATFEVVEKVGNDLRCKCADPGLLLPRAKLSFWRDGKLVEKSYELPTLSSKVKQIQLVLYQVSCNYHVLQLGSSHYVYCTSK